MHAGRLTYCDLKGRSESSNEVSIRLVERGADACDLRVRTRCTDSVPYAVINVFVCLIRSLVKIWRCRASSHVEPTQYLLSLEEKKAMLDLLFFMKM